jgi:hypothetical protein
METSSYAIHMYRYLLVEDQAYSPYYWRYREIL